MARLFIGLALNEELTQEILSWESNYLLWPVNWLASNNLHLTLVAPWDDKNKEEAKEIFTGFSGLFSPVSAKFSIVTFGPNQFSPRLIWAKGWSSEIALEIKRKIELGFNLPDDNRPFLTHLTLARFRPESFVNLPVKQLEEKISWEAIFDTLVLFESHLAPEGVEYERLQEIKLTSLQES